MQVVTTLDIDVPCAACGYNLRTLTTNAACPECGAEVAASLTPRPLAYAGRGVLRRIAIGLWLTLAATTLTTAAVAMMAGDEAWLAPLTFLPGSDRGWLVVIVRLSDFRSFGAPAIAIPLAAAGELLRLVAIWLVASPGVRPSKIPWHDSDRLRRACRFTAVVASAATIAMLGPQPDGQAGAILILILLDVVQLFLFLNFLTALSGYAQFNDLSVWFGRCAAGFLIAGAVVVFSLPVFMLERAWMIPMLGAAVAHVILATTCAVNVTRLALRIGRVRTLRE